LSKDFEEEEYTISLFSESRRLVRVGRSILWNWPWSFPLNSCSRRQRLPPLWVLSVSKLDKLEW